MPEPPGPLLARGEDADVFAIDDTRVLRRYRRRAVPERAFLGEFAPAEWRGGLDRAVAYRRADGNVSDKERDRLTKLGL